MELEYGCKILVTHVAGTRMISQGTDGISRGRLNQGVGVGEHMLAHCPWGVSALEASPNLLNEVKTWSTSPLVVLKPKDWFELGHDIHGWRLGYKGLMYPVIRTGFYLWVPPPMCWGCGSRATEDRPVKKEEINPHIYDSKTDDTLVVKTIVQSSRPSLRDLSHTQVLGER